MVKNNCLLGKMGACLVEGVQSRGVIACVKHYAFNSMENVRHQVNILCDKRTEQEVFLPHFRKCIEAGAGAVMCSYNSYQGQKCGQHSYLIRDVLKKEWGFDGFVISDFTWGITDTQKAVTAGLDVEMPNTFYYGESLKMLVQSNVISEEMIDEAAVRIIRTVLAHQAKIKKREMKESDFIKHRKLALRCALEGITLLKNEGNLLPLRSKGKRIVVLGELAGLEMTGDRGSSQVYPPYVVTALKGIVQNAAGSEVVYYDGKDLNHIRQLAKSADNVIVVAGNYYATEGECVEIDQKKKKHLGGDRENGLALRDCEIQLIKAVADVRADAIVVLTGGSMIDMEEWCDLVGAVLFIYYAGMEGGTALGRILFGKANPCGKLPFTIVKDTEDMPAIDWKAAEQRYEYYHGYTLLDKMKRLPRYAFGYGLSYTSFSLSDYKAWHENGKICASVMLENTGSMAGAEVVQMYVGVPDSVIERPHKVLKDFQKKYLKAGRKEIITLSCTIEDLSYYDEKTNSFVCESGQYDVYIGTSSAEDDLKSLRLTVSE